MERKESIQGRKEKFPIHGNASQFNKFAAIDKADNGNYDEAMTGFNEMIRLNPEDANSYFARATLKVRLGDIEGARQDFKMSELCRQKDDVASKYYPLV